MISGTHKPDGSNKQSSNNITINEIQEMYPALGDLESIRREARGIDMKEDPLIKICRHLWWGYYYDNW